MKKEEAIKRFQRMKKVLSIPNSDAERTIEAIDMAIEALSVVQCKDCKHYESDGGALMTCTLTDLIVNDDDFCSNGERRTK